MSPAVRAELDAEIFRNLCESPLYREAPSVFVYASFGVEADTRNLIKNALSLGKTVAVPRCTDDFEMNFYSIADMDDIIPGFHEIPEPSADCTLAVPSEGDIVIVPALSVDVTGIRLGFGGGYYDRYLARFPGAVTVCPCYGANIVERLPADAYDIPVKYIVNENKFREAADE